MFLCNTQRNLVKKIWRLDLCLSTHKMWGLVLPKKLLVIMECRTAAYPVGLKLQELGERSLIYSCVFLFPPPLVTDEGVGVWMPSLKAPYPSHYCKMFEGFQHTFRFLPQFSEARLMKNLFYLMFLGTIFLLLFIRFFPPLGKTKWKSQIRLPYHQIQGRMVCRRSK